MNAFPVQSFFFFFLMTVTSLQKVMFKAHILFFFCNN